MKKKCKRKDQLCNKKEGEQLQIIEIQRQQRIFESQQAQQELELKLVNARVKQDEQLSKMKKYSDLKQQKIKQRRREFEELKMQKMYENQNISIRTLRENKRSHGKELMQEEKKKYDFFSKLQEVEQRKDELDKLKQQKMISKKQQIYERELQSFQVLQNNEKQFEQKTNDFFKKRNNQYMKQDKKEALERIMRLQEYEKEIQRLKLQDKMRRAEMLQMEKNQMLEQRMMIKKEIGFFQIRINAKIRISKIRKTLSFSFKLECLQNSYHNIQHLIIYYQQHPPQNIKIHYQIKICKIIQDQNHNYKKYKQIIKILNMVIQNQGKFSMSSQYENQIDQQNYEMIDVLDEEQQLEFEREQAMANAKNLEEQKRLEKLFQIEGNKPIKDLISLRGNLFIRLNIREYQRYLEEFRNKG